VSSAGSRVRSAVLSALWPVLAAALTACSRDPAPAAGGTFRSDPPLLVAPLAREGAAARDAPPAVLHGMLVVKVERALPAGSRVRVWQGYRDEGHELAGAELRYALPPLAEWSGRATTVGAWLVAGPEHAPRAEATVRALPQESGWFEVEVPVAWDPKLRLEIALGDSHRADFGPDSSPLPLDLDLFAEVRSGAGGVVALAGSVPVRTVDANPKWLRVLAPATAPPGAPLRVVVDFMDDWSGESRSSAETPVPEGSLELALDGTVRRVAVAADAQRERPHGVEFELTAPDGGWHRIAATFRGGDGRAALRGLSAPLHVTADPSERLWFGSLHNHTLLGGHATSTPPRALAYARDVARLDFVALSEHREAPTFDGAWLADLAKRETADGRFVVFTAWEWTDAIAGHRHVVARAVASPPPAPPDLAAFARTVGRDPGQLVVVHHPLWDGGTAQRGYDYGAPGDLPRQKLAEAYSWHGDSFSHDSAFPLHGNHEQELPPERGTAIGAALARGHRLALVADGDGHLGRPGGLVGIEWPKGRRYAFAGVTAVRAPALTRDALFDALDRGDCYGTSGARIHVAAKRDGARVAIAIHAAAPLAGVELRSPLALLAHQAFPAAPRDDGPPDAPLFLDPAHGVWDTELVLSAGDGHETEPLVVEVAQQDDHRAWLLLPPPAWSSR
jgi:hypothetical protein